MNQFLRHTKFNFFVVLMLSSFLMTAQDMINIHGRVVSDDGSPAEEAGLLLIFDDAGMDDFVATDSNGDYSFNVDITEGSEGCFTVVLVDCDGAFIPLGDCYNSTNTDFEIDFLFCEFGSTFCSTFININPIKETGILLLNTLNIGVGPYDYVWSNGVTEPSQTVGADFVGEICVTVTDSQECISSNCVTLEPEDPCFVFISPSSGYQSTLLVAEGFGQSVDINYQWSNSQSGSQINVYESGEYCVTMTDALGCTAFDCIDIEVDSTEWLSCFADIYEVFSADGDVDSLVVESFGVSPFAIEWYLDGVFISEDVTVPTTVDGDYCIFISDGNDCSYSTCYDYVHSVDCSIEIDISQLESNNELFAVGYGVDPINYTWDNGLLGNQITVLESGEYCVTMEDNEGCISSACYTVMLADQYTCDGYISATIVDDTAAVLLANIFANNFEGEISYLWDNGEDSSELAVTEEGLYCVIISLENECEFEVCTYYSHEAIGVENGFIISYFDTIINQGQQAEIELYKFINDDLFLYDIVQEWSLLEGEGLYFIENVEEGTYLARAKPTNEEVYIPSYSSSSPYWEDSKLFTVQNGGYGLGNVANILTIPLNDTIGEGTIGGFSWVGQGEDNILLFFNGVVVRQAYTDINDQFTFESLPYGTYTVVRDIPGEERKEVVVTISAYNPFVTDVFFDEITTITTKDSKLDVEIFPNPTVNYITIKSEGIGAVSSMITLYDMNGAAVLDIDQQVMGEDMLILDISTVGRGVYFIETKVGNRIEMHRIIKV